MKKYVVNNINVNAKNGHYLIHVFYKDYSHKDIHAYNHEQLEKKINEFTSDPNFYDFFVYVMIDFDLDEKEQ